MSDITRYERPAITADCALFTIDCREDGAPALKVRLSRRPNAPEKGKWALLGAFVPIDDRIEDVMRRAVLDKGGYGKGFYASQLHTFDTPERDERWRVISVSYIGIVARDTAPDHFVEGAEWFYVDADAHMLESASSGEVLSFEALAFDHCAILCMALSRLRKEAASTDIALEFLRSPYTISDIRRVLETVTGKPSANTQRTFEKYIERASDEGQRDEEGKRPAHRPGILYKRREKRSE